MIHCICDEKHMTGQLFLDAISSDEGSLTFTMAADFLVVPYLLVLSFVRI